MNRRAFVRAAGMGLLGREVHLAHNENPYGPGPAALDAIRHAVVRGHRYPGDAADALIRAVSGRHQVPPEYVLVSGGSGDVMRAAVYALTSPTKALVTARPSYEAPMRSAQHIGSPVLRVPLTRALAVDVAAMGARAIGAGLVYLCSPNNPTSTVVSLAAMVEMVERVVAQSPGTFFLVDEAYFDYADTPGFGTLIPLALRYPQVIVTRTFSKIHGMAGMRVAYAIAHPDTLGLLRARHSRSSLGALSMAAATASLEDQAYTDQVARMNRQVRDDVTHTFTQAGYTVAKAEANFVFVNIRRDAAQYLAACRSRGVLIGRAFPPLGSWARISIGTADEMALAMPTFLDVLASQPVRTTN